MAFYMKPTMNINSPRKMPQVQLWVEADRGALRRQCSKWQQYQNQSAHARKVISVRVVWAKAISDML